MGHPRDEASVDGCRAAYGRQSGDQLGDLHGFVTYKRQRRAHWKNVTDEATETGETGRKKRKDEETSDSAILFFRPGGRDKAAESCFIARDTMNGHPPVPTRRRDLIVATPASGPSHAALG